MGFRFRSGVRSNLRFRLYSSSLPMVGILPHAIRRAMRAFSEAFGEDSPCFRLGRRANLGKYDRQAVNAR